MDIYGVLSKGSEKGIVVVSAGKNGQVVAEALVNLNVKVLGFVDNDVNKQGKKLGGLEIQTADYAAKHYKDVVYVIANLSCSEVLCRQLMELEISIENILVLDMYDLLNIKRKCLSLWKKEERFFCYDEPVRKGVDYWGNWVKFWLEQRKHLYRKKKKATRVVKYKTSICAIFKNEGMYLKEWLDYHILIGVEHFYLYNNNSTDSWEGVLYPYIDKGYVTLIDWPYQQGQIAAYVDCVDKYSNESGWIGFIDLDEFVTPIQYDNISDFLSKFEKYGSVWIPWKVFGSSGLVERDTKRMVTVDFVDCWKKPMNVGKCFYNTSFELCREGERMSQMHHQCYTVNEDVIYPPVNAHGQYCCMPICGGISKELPIQINHYVTKSRMEYQRKIGGTDVYFCVNSHTEKAFLYHDEQCDDKDERILRFVKLLME